MKAGRWIGAGLAALLFPLAIGGVRAQAFLAREPAPMSAASSLESPPNTVHERGKPTVAVVLGADVTEITDMVGPYEIFARADRFNVYAVAPSTASATLTGGLRVRPHYSFDELDELLEGAPPAIVVAPNVPNIRSSENRPVVEWVRRSADAGATMLSWCAGAAVLAEAGLLDGRTATSHWGDLSRLEREYPLVQWQRGVRWVDHGKVLTSAGITSGIDATLRLLIRTEGEDIARRIAGDLRYPHFRFALDPSAEQYSPRLSDAVLFLNAAFRPSRQQIGVALHDGVGELDVSTLYDAHAAAGVAEVHAVSAETRLIRTAHGLWLEPALAVDRESPEIAKLDRLVVPGLLGRAQASSLILRLASVGAPAPEFVHAEAAARFGLEPVLEDLAANADLVTATFAKRRLEYRSSSLRLSGAALPLGAPLVALSLAFLAFLAFLRGAQAALRLTRPLLANATRGTRAPVHLDPGTRLVSEKHDATPGMYLAPVPACSTPTSSSSERGQPDSLPRASSPGPARA